MDKESEKSGDRRAEIERIKEQLKNGELNNSLFTRRKYVKIDKKFS